MSLLRRKLARDVWAGRLQIAAVTLIVGLGVGTFYGAQAAYENLSVSGRLSYDRLRFADVTVAMERAPSTILRSLARIPGIRQIEGRIVLDVVMEQDSGRRLRVTGRVISLPMEGRPAVNNVRLLEGHWPTQSREALLEASFARYHGYRPGDHIYPLLEGRRLTATVAGIVASPEYVYPVRSKQFRVASPETFGVCFALQRDVDTISGLAGNINEVVMRTTPGDAQRVGDEVSKRLRPFGSQLPMLRVDQPSDQMLRSDLESSRPTAVVIPILLLASAALAVSLVLARWVQAQQGHVGFLRASGFSARAILQHYLEFGLVVGVTGVVLGLPLGLMLIRVMGGLYETLIEMPYQVRDSHPEYAACAVILSLLASVLGALGPARQAASIPPAVAMRGVVPPESSRGTRHMRLPLILAMPIRNLTRRPLQTIGTASGIASAVVVLVVPITIWDSANEAEQVYLRDNLRYDASVTFVPPRSENFLAHLRQWPGVQRVEATLELPVRVERGGKMRETMIIGFPPDSRLRRLPQGDGTFVTPQPGCVLPTDALARRMDLHSGDLVTLAYTQNTPEKHATVQMHAQKAARQSVGQPVYVRLADLQRTFAAPIGLPPDAITGALMSVDPAYLPQIRDRLHRMDGVAVVQTRQQVQAQVQNVFNFTRAICGMMFMLSAVMAFLVTHTAPEIVLWLRTRELATLRTLGFSMPRIALLISMENLSVAVLGVVIGLLPGLKLTDYLLALSQSESFSFRMVVRPLSCALIVAGVLALALLGQAPGLRRISRLDLASMIRQRE